MTSKETKTVIEDVDDIDDLVDDEKYNPLNLKAPAKKKPSSTDESIFDHPYFKYILIGLSIVVIVLVIIMYYRKMRALQPKDDAEEDEPEDNRIEQLENVNEQLRNEVQQLQMSNQSYVEHINRLADQLEAQKTYSPVLPMKQDSYDAPDPDTPQEKPQIIKDKEQIKQMINSRRPTVQDELDQQEQTKKEQSDADEKQALNDIKAATQIDDSNSESEEGGDKDVQSLMDIIQSQ